MIDAWEPSEPPIEDEYMLILRLQSIHEQAAGLLELKLVRKDFGRYKCATNIADDLMAWVAYEIEKEEP